METQQKTADEIKDLKACLNDLITVLALPAIWSIHEPFQIVSTLLEALVGMQRLDFAYVRLGDSFGCGAPIEMSRSYALRPGPGRSAGATPQTPATCARAAGSSIER